MVAAEPVDLALRALNAGDPAEVTALARLIARAYPLERPVTAAQIAENEKMLAAVVHDPGTRIIVAYREGRLAGVMRLYDFTMRVRDGDALTCGIGSVGVDYPHKKNGLARALVRAALLEYRERKAPFAALYPFRPDFYRALGFGYGAKIHAYAFVPSALPDDPGRRSVRLLGVEDLDAFLACYERIRARTPGLIAKIATIEKRMLDDPARETYGFEADGVLSGFVTVAVGQGERNTVNTNRLVVNDLQYEHARALRALVAFLRAQGDQFERIEIRIQNDDLYLLAADPRDGSNRNLAIPAWHRTDEAGVGIMYRILDVDAAFAYLRPLGEPVDLRLVVRDEILDAVAGTYAYRLGGGAATRLAQGARADAELRIDIAELSSLVMGAVRLRSLAELGIVEVPEPWLERLDRAFAADRPPRTTTRF